jgi:hypothetical protein
VMQVDWDSPFWRRVHPEALSGCWLWHGATNPKGYGSAWVDKKSMLAHRRAYELAIGQVPSGMHVLHRCDVPACVNPEHLFLGTHADNMADMHRKMRWRPAHNPGPKHPLRGERWHEKYANRRTAQGSRSPNTSLTEQDVAVIRTELASGVSQSELARRTGISRTVINSISTRRSWRHVP